MLLLLPEALSRWLAHPWHSWQSLALLAAAIACVCPCLSFLLDDLSRGAPHYPFMLHCHRHNTSCPPPCRTTPCFMWPWQPT